MTRSPRFRVPLMFVGALLLHTTVLASVRLAGVMPDLMLLLAVAAGVTAGPGRGAAVGFGAGMILDFFLRTPLGLSALVFTLVGYGVGVTCTGVLRSSWYIPVVTALLGSGAGVLLYALAGAVLGEPLVSPRLPVIIAVVALANAVMAPVVVRVVAWALMVDRSPGSRLASAPL